MYNPTRRPDIPIEYCVKCAINGKTNFRFLDIFFRRFSTRHNHMIYYTSLLFSYTVNNNTVTAKMYSGVLPDEPTERDRRARYHNE